MTRDGDFLDEDFELMEAAKETEESPKQEEVLELRPTPKYFKDLRDLPEAAWEDCVGKSVPPEGTIWPKDFCLMCKATKIDPDTGEKCKTCNGTGKYPKDITGKKFAASQKRVLLPGRKQAPSKWTFGLPEIHEVEKTGDPNDMECQVTRNVFRIPGKAWWTSRVPPDTAINCSVRVHLLRESVFNSQEIVEGATVTKIIVRKHERELAIRLAEKIARQIDAGWHPSRFPKIIELYKRNQSFGEQPEEDRVLDELGGSA
jgi:hypothetical protein